MGRASYHHLPTLGNAGDGILPVRNAAAPRCVRAEVVAAIGNEQVPAIVHVNARRGLSDGEAVMSRDVASRTVCNALRFQSNLAQLSRR